MLFKRMPVDHIRPKALLDIFTKKRNKKKVMNRYQYEFYIYRSIRENLKKCQIYVNDPLGYKSFEEEVKIDANWEKEKVKKLKALNNPVLSSPIDATLEQLKSLLEPLLKRTNERAMRGENHYINIKKHRDGSKEWTRPYPKKNDEIDNPFYDKLETRSISEVFDFVEQRCHFMKAFTHIKPKESSHQMDYVGIKGVLYQLQ